MGNTDSHGGFTRNDGVESVDGVSGVLDNATGAVGFHQVIDTPHVVPIACLLLTLAVTGQGVLDVLSEPLLGVGVVVRVNGHGGGRKRSLGGDQKTRPGDSHNGSQR
jgi:hypothetical protein